MHSDSYFIRSTSHLITIPFPPAPHFLVQVLHLKDSLSISVSQSPNPNQLPPNFLSSQSTTDSDPQASNRLENEKEKENDKQSQGTKEEEEVDEELSKALKESGRIESGNGRNESVSVDEIQNILPLPRISKEWSVAMNPIAQNTGSKKYPPSSTSLFRTPPDLSRPMSLRLGQKFKKSQLFLSLDLPEVLLPSPQSFQMGGGGNDMGSMERNKGLLLLEKGIATAVEMGMQEVRARQS